MVPAEGYDAGEGLLVFGWAGFFCVGGRRAREEAVVAFFDLLDCVGVVVARIVSVLHLISVVVWEVDVRCDRYISAIEDGGPTVERVGVQGDIVAAAESHSA